MRFPFWRQDSRYSSTGLDAFVCVSLSVFLVQANAQDLRKDCGFGVSVTAAEVFSGMIPPSPNIPETCETKTAQVSRRFAQEDRDNWEALSNRACSAKLGWVENSPGICTAGGPPPICKRTDHWHKDSGKAEQEWQRFKHDQYAEPRQQLITDAGCGCWLDTVSNQSGGRTPSAFNPYSPTQNSYNPYSQEAIVPCSTTAECQVPLPGSVCSERKSCEIPKAITRQATGAAAYVDGKITNHAADEVLDMAETQMLKLLSPLG